MKTLMQFIGEAATVTTRMTAGGDPYHRLDGAAELRVTKPFELILGGRVSRGYPAFKVKVKKGDTIFNLPGGVFLKRKSGKYDDFPAGWVLRDVASKYGASVGFDKITLTKIANNTEVVS